MQITCFLIVCKRHLQVFATSAYEGTLPELDIVLNLKIISWVGNQARFVLINGATLSAGFSALSGN